jgi:hypothetical protein
MLVMLSVHLLSFLLPFIRLPLGFLLLEVSLIGSSSSRNHGCSRSNDGYSLAR